MRLTVIILTYNEEVHIARCIASVGGLSAEILVVDSYSTDRTVEIAESLGARVIKRRFDNQASQFNWSLAEVNPESEWVLRLDADEYLTPHLVAEIRQRLPRLRRDIAGICLRRYIKFRGRLIRYGGVSPVSVLRLFRAEKGFCEQRWMDEHIRVSGEVAALHGALVDDNLKSLTWWTDKHNRYASREAVEMLNLEFQFLPPDSAAGLKSGQQAGVKRWIKNHIYFHLPAAVRAAAYFGYRYFIRFGFMDGKEGASFHFFQAFWYRYLVDAKAQDVKRYMLEHRVGIEDAIKEVLELDLTRR